jgi:hypothetical protein
MGSPLCHVGLRIFSSSGHLSVVPACLYSVGSSHKAVLLLATKQSTALFRGHYGANLPPTNRAKARYKKALFRGQHDPNLQPIQSVQSICKLARYEARPQSKFPTRPTASKPYIARSDCAYLIEQ